MLRTRDLEYDLPDGFVATSPAVPRDAARMMVARRAAGSGVEHRRVRDLPDVLGPGDLLIRNTTRVLPARLRGVRADTGGAMEGLYLGPARPLGGSAGPDAPGLLWEAMVKLRRMKPGVIVSLSDRSGRASGVTMELVERCPERDGSWVVRVDASAAQGLEGEGTLGILDRVGLTPLPPYIRAARKAAHVAESEERDRERYQTLYAHEDQSASVAAPTAGLHFTPKLDERLRRCGVSIAEVVLHVGAGTFKPIETEFVEQHTMHAEWCAVPRPTGLMIERTRRHGGRVIAVGTTSARTLESFTLEQMTSGQAEAGHATRLLITPGYEFTTIDGLLTNFHLPRSTLLAMVAAMLDGGVARLLELYREAMDRGYRFYSYGDAMLILP